MTKKLTIYQYLLDQREWASNKQMIEDENWGDYEYNYLSKYFNYNNNSEED